MWRTLKLQETIQKFYYGVVPDSLYLRSADDVTRCYAVHYGTKRLLHRLVFTMIFDTGWSCKKPCYIWTSDYLPFFGAILCVRQIFEQMDSRKINYTGQNWEDFGIQMHIWNVCVKFKFSVCLSTARSVFERDFSLSKSCFLRHPSSNPGHIRVRQLHSFRFNIFLLIARNLNQTRHQMMHIPTRDLIRGNENTEIATRGPKLGQRGQKMESFVRTYQIRVHSKIKVVWVISAPGGGQKSQFVVVFGPPADRKPSVWNCFWGHQYWANVAQNRIISEDWYSKYTQQTCSGLSD